MNNTEPCRLNLDEDLTQPGPVEIEFGHLESPTDLEKHRCFGFHQSPFADGRRPSASPDIGSCRPVRESPT